MQSHCLSEHIVTNAAHLHCIGCEELAPIHEATTLKSDRIVALVHDQHADDTLITINNKVASKLVHVLLLGDQLGLGHASEVAVSRAHHHWDFTNADVDLLWVLVINATAESGIKRSLVSKRTQAAFSRVYL